MKAIHSEASTAVEESPCSSPYATAPSSPKHPDDDSFSTAPPSPTSTHEESSLTTDDETDDFSFEFSVHYLNSNFVYAEELFDSGVIRPLKPLPHLQICSKLIHSHHEVNTHNEGGANSNCTFSRRKIGFEYPILGAGMESAQKAPGQQHGLRRDQLSNGQKNIKASSFSRVSSCSSCSSFKSCSRWRLRDMLSFRAGSVGVRKEGEDGKRASFDRSTRGYSFGSGRWGVSLSGQRLAGGEGKTGSGELKRKGETATSCKRGFWECMRRFNHGEPHGQRLTKCRHKLEYTFCKILLGMRPSQEL